MTAHDKKLIWDVPVRICHWLLVILIPWSWYAVEVNDDLDTHMLLGYCIITLLMFRIAWGFIGTRYARFSSLMFRARDYISSARTLFSRQHGNDAGHNPLGALSVMVMLLLLTLQAVTGLFSNDEEYYFGPLSDNISSHAASIVTRIHHVNFNILLGFILLHILAVLFYFFYKRQNLITAMVTGRKSDVDGALEAITGSRLPAAAVLLLISSALVYCLVRFA